MKKILLLIVTMLLLLVCVVPASAGFLKIYSFPAVGSCGTDACSPDSQLYFGGSSTFYGFSSGGGANGAGTLYKLVNNSGTWTESVVYSFATCSFSTCDVGGGQFAADSNLNFYFGNGWTGGSKINKLTLSGGSYSLSTLYTLNGGSEGSSVTRVIRDSSSGTLYGIANGSTATLWSLTTGGTFTVLHSFTGSDIPSGDLLANGGNIWGVAESGGAHGDGYLWKYKLSNSTYTDVYDFSTNHGSAPSPVSGVSIDSSGNIFGTFNQGGASGVGEIWKLTNNGGGSYTFADFYAFTGGNGASDGGNPQVTPLLDSSGNLFGLTYDSITGSIYEVNSSGSLVSARSFNPAANEGAFPLWDLIYESGSASYYGVTSEDLRNNVSGAAFKVN